MVAPDHLGFGRSDKPTDDDWYTISRHREALARLVDALDLNRIHLVVQDWAGPIGLVNAVADRDRYARLFILNTWLHADDHEYSEGVQWWRQAAIDPEQLSGDMPTGVIVAGATRRPDVDRDLLVRAFDAPFTDAASKAGARRFPFWYVPRHPRVTSQVPERVEGCFLGASCRSPSPRRRRTGRGRSWR